MQTPAPGSRVVIRDEEWLVRRVDPSTDGGHLLTCDGISELVRGKSALFLTVLEGLIEILDPATTELVIDTSPQYSAALLAIESQRRRTVANDASIHLGHRGAMNLVAYQLDPALQALKQPRARILIADSVGLGKTLEAGILATELMQRGRGKRILVITQKSMLTQFQKEWWCRFSIPLVRLDSVGLARVRNRIPANHNPFNHFDRSIISIDTLKSNLEYRNYLENAWWDIIVIDECHNVAVRAGEQGVSRRARLARLLATRSDTMILLSATPHDGSARSFASLMSLLDPTAISDPDDYSPEDFRHKGLVVRRFKKDIRDQVSSEFQERSTHCLRQAASPAEEAAYRALLAVRFTQSGKHNAGKAQQLQRVGMQKGLFSSPAAAADSVIKRIALLRAKPDISADERTEIEGLTELGLALQAIGPAEFSKYQRFITELRSASFAWQPDTPTDRLVVFSERIETLRWLHAQLTLDLKLKPKQIELLHGQMGDKEQQDLVDAFGRQDNPLRILLCSDVASEGLNLHYFCHRLVHFDLPWSLMVFQQRNGRVDRYGQKQPPQIVYLFTESTVDGIRGDLRILEILQTKDDQAYKNLGDPSAFLNVYDPDKEADKVASFMVEGLAPEQVEAKLDATLAAADENEGDWLMELFGVDHAVSPAADHVAEPSAKYLQPPASSLDAIAPGHSLFASDYQWAKTALTLLSAKQLAEGNGTFANWQGNDAEATIAITAPLDLKERLRQLPNEAQAAADHYTLCASPHRMMEAMETARQARAEDDTWPTLHYLWPQHPIMEWLADRVLANFGRHQAPVLQSAQLPAGAQAFVLMSLVPNRKGQPLLVEWQVAYRADAAASFSLEPFDDFAQRIGLKAAAMANRSSSLPPPLPELQAGLPLAVAAMSAFMQAKQAIFAASSAQRLQGTLDDLERLQGRQITQLSLQLENQLEAVRRGRFERRTEQIHRVFDDYRQWVQDTLTTEPLPWIQVVAALCHPASHAAGADA